MLKAIGKIGIIASNAAGLGNSKTIIFQVNQATLGESYPDEGVDYGNVVNFPNEYTYYDFGKAALLESIDLSLCTLSVLDKNNVVLISTTLDALSSFKIFRSKLHPEFTVTLDLQGEITSSVISGPPSTSLIIFTINILNVLET